MVIPPTFPINLIHLSGILPEPAAKLLEGAPPLGESETAHLTVLVSDQISLVKDWIASNPTPSWVLLAGPEADWHCTQALELGASECWSSQENEALLPFRIARAEQLAVRNQEMREQTNDLSVLMELTATLTSAQDIGDILRTVVTRVVELGSFGRASIVLAPDESDPSVGFVVAASDDDELTNLRLDLKKYPEVQHVLKTGHPVFIPDVATHDLLTAVRDDTPNVGSMNLFPLAWDGETMGALFLRARDPGIQLHPRQLSFCKIVSQATGIALRNAQVIQSLRDHTQQMSFAKSEAEHRLRSLEQYAALFRSAAEGIAVLDLSGDLVFANPRAFEIVGAPKETIDRPRMLDWVSPESRDTVANLWQNIRAGEYARGVDLEILDARGERLWCSCSFTALPEDESVVLLSFMDVTAQRETERELKRTKEFLESLIQTTVDGIIAADMDGIVIVFNEGAEKLFKLQADEVIGKLNVRDLYADDAAFEVMKLLRSDAQGGKGQLTSTRFEIRDSRGATVPISLTASLVYEKGKPIATCGIFTDLRERVRVEQRLAHAQERLAMTEKQAVIAELAGTTAHELNQPLTSVSAYCELLLLRLPSDSPEHRAAAVITEEVARMATIVRKIGRVTRYETTSYVGEQRILDLDRASTQSDPPPRIGEPNE